MMPLNIQMVFAFLFGLCIGSFLNVCIYRIPIKKSIVSPPSGCTSCGKKIGFYDNIPVLSYLILRGRCRYCHESISIMYPLIELVTGLLSVALLIRFNIFNHQFYFYFIFMIFTAALLCVSFIDLRHQIIPDVISLPGIIAGFILSFFSSHITWVHSLIGILVGGGILYIVALLFEVLMKKEGMGGGDIKLLAMIGAWLGWKAVPFVILLSSLTGLLLGGASLVISRQGIRSRIPFGPFLSLSALIYIFYGNEIINWYFNIMLFGNTGNLY
ncbi:prepilin peptidase [Thermodesulfobacteriota bacterium]